MAQHTKCGTSVSRRLVAHLVPWTEIEREAVACFDRGKPIEDHVAVLHVFWENYWQLPPHERGRRRLFMNLIGRDERLDGYSAPMLVDFARDAGLADRDILEAFEGGI